MNTLTFFAPSGSPAGGIVVEQLDPPGNTSGTNSIGFFGAGGPQGVPFAVIVAKFQDSTYITNVSGFNMGVEPFGIKASGKLNNFKFESTGAANVSGVAGVLLVDIPAESGTVLIRFEPSGVIPVRTQNTLLRTVPLNSVSGVDNADDIVIGLVIQGFEPGVDGVWTKTAGNEALDNRLFISDHDDTDLVHDFFVSLSASPEAVGERNNFGFFFIIEFL